MSALIAICLVGLISMWATTIYKLFKTDRKERLKFLKSFREGKFAFICMVALPLYYLGILYSGNDFGGTILLSISATVGAIVLKFDYNSVSALMMDDMFYRVVMSLFFVTATMNAVVFAFTLLGRNLSNLIRRKLIVTRANIGINVSKIYLVIGYSDQNIHIADSIIKNKEDVILFAKPDQSQIDELYIKKIAYYNYSPDNNLVEMLSKLFKRFDNSLIKVIINTGDDATNLILTSQISEFLLKNNLTDFYDHSLGLKAFVFGMPANKSTFIHYVEKSNGNIKYIDKYALIATDFVDEFPLTEFMTDEHIDYSTATIKENVDINMVMIGFGKTNQQLLLTSIANNQFLTLTKDGLREKLVNYWVFDKEKSQCDKNLNHNYFRFKNECEQILKDEKNKDKYLEPPADPANINYCKKNVNDEDFYACIKEKIIEKTDYNTEEGIIKNTTRISYNYIVIAFGNDMENLDFGKKICMKLKEWKLEGNTKIFVKIRDLRLLNDVVENDIFNSNSIYSFACEKKLVYVVDKIVDEKFEKMAIARHILYAVEYFINENISEDMNEVELSKNIDEVELTKNANKQWYIDWHQIQRDSNVYACLSIRSKLHMLGFDYAVKKDKDEPCANDDYIKKYTFDDNIIYSDNKYKDKLIIKYCNDNYMVNTINIPKTTSIRGTFAVQEHSRWNAYMISMGMVPASIDEIKNCNKNELLNIRKHKNITTFNGLIDYRNIIAEHSKKSSREITLEKADVIRYDYQLMDDLRWLLDEHGYKIIKKNNPES